MSSTLRHIGPLFILALFCLYFFFAGLANPKDVWHRLTAQSHTPDFSHYTGPKTLSADHFPLDDPHRRVIILGDIHGMNEPFRALLDKLSYNPPSDVLIHVGDIIAKGPHEGSMAVLSFMASHNITGVRGNHDQKVIEWRSWLAWIGQLDGGALWLRDFHAAAEAADPDDPEKWAARHIKRTRNKWRKRIPKGWKILSDHYRVARAMSEEEYKYLLALPLVLHVPSAHTLIAHAGVLPSDPRYKPYHRRQPLARIPSLPHDFDSDLDFTPDPSELRAYSHSEKTLPLLRRLQEAALLSEVPQNRDPWVTLNMRGILEDNTITRAKDGEPWAERWNAEMGMCGGFDRGHKHIHRAHREDALPCYPATVVYGHAASRGLDVKRWSVGLDSGCVSNRRLSALVLDSKSSSPSPASKKSSIEARKKLGIPFGEEGRGLVVDVSCK
ncbi:Metallo-dependent phosphatase-like protein [Mycena alexandri]|uniref:Metallo-dependent phosphatase-like protein n=1 Tax=Mycena alexandri TaxID=1745969 RepID=A0AAD6SWH7_9AGAR|nr:Metallo-dependent phosphatase-like protein [Mycena alexandri]